MQRTTSSQAGASQARSGEGHLRPAGARSFLGQVSVDRGSFDLVPQRTRRSSDLAKALTTCVLVLYPVLASVGVVAAGLLLSGAGLSS